MCAAELRSRCRASHHSLQRQATISRRGSSEALLRELCSGLRHRVRRRSIMLPRRPLCTFQAATGREAAPCGMATVGTGRAFKCATDRVTPSEQREQPASAGCFLLGENHRGLPKCGADSVSASALKGVLRSCGTNVPRVCYFHNMRRRQEPVPIGEVPCHKRKAFRSIHFSVRCRFGEAFTHRAARHSVGADSRERFVENVDRVIEAFPASARVP